jgi:hypothetical protein
VVNHVAAEPRWIEPLQLQLGDHFLAAHDDPDLRPLRHDDVTSL